MESKSIPVGRIIEKLDEYLNKKDYAGARRLLKYWLLEADSVMDDRGKLTILNEQIGLYRKTECEEECMSAIDSALLLARSKPFFGTVTGATTFLNAATGYKAFGYSDKAVVLYKTAKEIYEKELSQDDSRLAGLYNNMALALTDIKEYEQAKELYEKALQTLSFRDENDAEKAITFLNLADLVNASNEPEEAEPVIEKYLMEAKELLDSVGLKRDGYYAFVCEKCAPVFGYYGYFKVKEELMKRAEMIYEGN